METGTQLTVAERAQVALGSSEHEAKLRELVKHAQGVGPITNAVTYAECHGARMSLKNARVAIEKAGKAARADATAYAKGVIAEENRLLSIGEPEERRLEEMQRAHDERVAREKEARERAKAERIARIQSIIDNDIKLAAVAAANKGSVEIATFLADIEASAIDEKLGEVKAAAEQAKMQTVTTLRELHAAALEHEEEQRRIKAEREELARLKAAEDQRQREAAEREAQAIRQRAAEEKAARDKIEAEERAARERIFEEARQARIANEEADRIAREKREAQEAAFKAERDRIDAEHRALDERQRQERLAKEERERLDREEAEAKEREAKRKINEALDARQMLLAFVAQYGHLKEFARVVKAIDAALQKVSVAA